MTSCDVLVMLQRRNLEHVIDRILSYLGAISQMSLALSSSSHHQLVTNNKVARKKISAWRRWMRRDPTTGTLFDKEGSIVTSLSQGGLHCDQSLCLGKLRGLLSAGLYRVFILHLCDGP